VYRSTFPSSPVVETYLRHGGMTALDEAAPDMVTRVVAALATVDRHFSPSPRESEDFAQRLGQDIDAGRIVLSPTIMANAGRGPPRPLATCAAPPVNLRSDLRTIQSVVDRYHQAGMGTGFNLDGLEDPVAMLQFLNYVAAVGTGTTGTSTGAASGTSGSTAPPDMELGLPIADAKQPMGNIALLSLSHPRADDFVASKVGASSEGEAWRFNIALRVHDADIHAALRRPGRERSLLFAAARAAHTCSEPGLVFIDRLEESNPTPFLGPYMSTSPYAEVGLLAGETCVFGQVNLARFHREAPRSIPVDFDALAETVYTLVRALDDAVEVGLTLHPTALSSELTRANRKIALGVCGLADLLNLAGVPYDSLQGHVIAQEVLAYVGYVAKLASVELAVRRDPCPAVARGRSRYADPDFLRRFTVIDVRSVTNGDWAALADRVAESGLLRNVATTAIPPTPQSAALVGASNGIDPVRVATNGRANPTGHLTMAAAVQACVDEAVSTTIHLPAGTGPDDVYDTYIAAWELRCKSVAVAVDD
jgi:ribonucleoside-diphosphate reductase alpha chain